MLANLCCVVESYWLSIIITLCMDAGLLVEMIGSYYAREHGRQQTTLGED